MQEHEINNKLFSSAMRLIFWGMILEFLDFIINGFDILPDILGVLIIIAGLSRIKNINSFFHKARLLSFAILFFTIYGEFGFVYSQNQIIAIIIGVFIMVIQLIYLCFLCRGISEFSLTIENFEFPKIIAKRYKIYVCLLIINYVLLLIFPYLLIVSIILVFIAYTLILDVIYKAKKMCDIKNIN